MTEEDRPPEHDEPVFSVKVPTLQFRAALEATLPLAAKSKKDTMMHRVRIILDAPARRLYVGAARYGQSGMACIELEDDSIVAEPDPGAPATRQVDTVDIMPDTARNLIRFFTAKDIKTDDLSETLRLDVSSGYFRATDCGGLFASGKGEQYTRVPTNRQYPDLRQMTANGLAREVSGTGRLVVNATLLAGLEKAAKLFGHPLVIEMSGEHSVAVISIGQVFVALVMPIKFPDQDDAQIREWRADWTRALPPGDGSEEQSALELGAPDADQDDEDVADQDDVRDREPGPGQVPIFNDGGQEPSAPAWGDERRELVRRAAEYVITAQGATAAKLRTALGVTLKVADDVMDDLEFLRVIGPAKQGTTKRDVLIERGTQEAFLAGLGQLTT